MNRDTARVLGASFDYPPGGKVDTHHHASHQLVYAVRGVMSVTTTHGTWVVPPHRALWISAGVEHAIRMVGAVQMRTLYVDAATRGAANVGKLGGCAVIPVRPLLRELIVELVALEVDRRSSSGDHATAIASLVLAEMTQLQTQPLHVPLPTATRLRRICEEVQADPGSALTSAEWSARFGLSAKTLERDFSKGLAMTFGRWRQQVRILASLERLADGEAVTRVAMDLGYRSPSAFAAMFRKALGCAPSRYFA